jgi:exodeoxyribonuclease V alpha subunit
LYSEIENKDSFFLSANQKKAVENCFKNQIHIVTGGPGTGKSTIVNVLLKICEKHELSTVLTAPTGRAAKRMTEITNKNANTIHSLLSIDFNSEKNHSRNKVKVEADFILVDELSMVDTFLMSCFLEAVQVGSRIVFIGDSDQLPSVGPGKVLKDFIESGKVDVSHLNEIFRQKNYSKIIQNAHLINSGKLPDVSIQKESDFFFIRESNPEKISDLIVDLLSNRLKKAYHFNPTNDIQVLCPVHKGMIGTIEINQKIQNTLNPQSEKKETYFFRNQRFTVGDKVIQNKNNYEKSVFNGDIGIVKKINLIDKLLYVKFEGEEIEYDFGELNEIDLAYALSVHKFQGSEVPCVIMPVHDSNQFMLSRNLLYTAVTRAKKLLILIGTENALESAVQNLKGIERFSGLKFFLSDKHSDKFPEIKIVPMPGSIGYEDFIREKGLI